MRNRHETNRLYCFSPPVMLATLVIEFSLAIYTIWRYKMNTVGRLAVAILLALGSFQLAEYMICGGLGFTNIDWARFGYISITLLPALGIHMLNALVNEKKQLVVGVAYATCTAFVTYYLFNTNSISSQTCLPNYAVFHTTYPGSILYGAYYYGWLLIGIFLAWHYSKKYPKKRIALTSMILGYLAFIVPTAFFNIIDPTTTSAIPSIMCGFAIMLAFVIVFRVLPNSAPVNNSLKEFIKKNAI